MLDPVYKLYDQKGFDHKFPNLIII